MTEAAPPHGRGATVRFAVVGTSLLALTVAHFATDPHQHDVHNLLFKATYLPLILAGLWFGVRGALIWTGVTCGAYVIHLVGQLHGHQSLWVGFLDLGLYNVVALTTAVLSQRRAQALSRAESHARALEENARALLRAEETIRRSERLRGLGELAAGMAHEIRNPLGGIRGAGEVLRRSDTPPDVREEFGALLESEIARLDAVVGNFLEFARPRPAEVADVGVREAVDALMLLLRPEAAKRQVELSNAVAPEVHVHADAGLLRQILLNLVLNAIQIQKGGGRVEISAAESGGSVSVDVTDTGPGVPPQVRDRIFDPYVTAREDGSGLGLAVAVRLATSMDGTLCLLRSAPGDTAFRLVLPAG